MTLEYHKPALVLAGLVCILIIVVALIASFWPTQEDWFFELGLLDKDKTAYSYFADENSTVAIGTANTWFVYVHNHMGEVENIIIKAKLLNSTEDLPNNNEHKASPSVSVAEFPLLLDLNETVLIPFSWSITKIEAQNDLTIIRSLIVNEQSVDVDVSAFGDSQFGLAFELWIWDQLTHKYSFLWNSGGEFASVSINMWFQVSASVS